MRAEILDMLRQNEELKKEITRLELKLQLLERAVEYLAESLDETDMNMGLKPENLYLVKQILKK